MATGSIRHPWTQWGSKIAFRGLGCCVIGLATLALPSSLSAQTAVEASARAEIAPGVTLINTRDMDFGRLIVPRNGRADMPAVETPNCTTNNGLILLDACESASFTGNAQSGLQVRVSVPPGRRINLTGPDRPLRLRRMTVGAGDGLAFLGRTNRHFDFTVNGPTGDFEFFVGARLLFRNNQGAGLYTGTFTIQMDYQ